MGSEFSGSVEFTAETKLAILGGLSATFGGSYKETRSVGISATIQVRPGYTGFIEAYYEGVYNGGTLYRDVYWGGEYQTTRSDPVSSTVHRADYVAVNFRVWEEFGLK